MEINVLESQVFLIVTYTTYVRLLSNSRHSVKGKLNNGIGCVYLFCSKMQYFEPNWSLCPIDNHQCSYVNIDIFERSILSKLLPMWAKISWWTEDVMGQSNGIEKFISNFS